VNGLDLISHYFLFTANSLGHQPTTSKFFQTLALQILEKESEAIHCALSDYATGHKATVICGQDKYHGKFCPSPVMNSILQAAALINSTDCSTTFYPHSSLQLNLAAMDASYSPQHFPV